METQLQTHECSICKEGTTQHQQTLEDFSHSITFLTFFKLSQTPCFSFASSFIKLLKSKENQWTLRNTWPEVTATIWHTCVHGHNEKASGQQKKFISDPCVNKPQRQMTIFHAEESVAALQMRQVCVCVRADWTQIRGGVTGHSLIEQQPECDCCSSLSLRLLT